MERLGCVLILDYGRSILLYRREIRARVVQLKEHDEQQQHSGGEGGKVEECRQHLNRMVGEREDEGHDSSSGDEPGLEEGGGDEGSGSDRSHYH